MELSGQISYHSWGKLGSKSRAGIFYRQVMKRNQLDENTKYSILTFSANPSPWPTVLSATNEPLHLFIEKNADVIGKHGEQFQNRLPFQIRIICLEKGMSLACYPPKEEAERLHRKYPRRYSSVVHKPKLIIALHYLEVMVGFRQRNEIVSFISGIPELSIIIPLTTIEDYLCTGKIIYLKRMFYYLMLASHQEIKQSLDVFFSRLRNADSKAKAAVNYNVLKNLFEQFSYDSGVYAPLFLNHIIINPGQALFIPSGTVHTYLHGDCFEVSTDSQNILRCGLTKKFKHIDEFLNIADFSPCSKDKFLLEATMVDIFMMSFVPPIKDLQVARISVPEEFTYTVEEKESCSIAMVTRGTAILDDFRRVSLGTTLFLLPYQKLTFKVKEDITIYIVFPNLDCEDENCLY